jgi:hypothetical protein
MITQGYLSRHFQGRSGMRDPALLDVAQDYALKHLHDQGAFELGIVLKGGTSLRKLRAQREQSRCCITSEYGLFAGRTATGRGVQPPIAQLFALYRQALI